MLKSRLKNRELLLRGWRSLEQRRTEGQFHAVERSSGLFIRRMKLPESVEKDAIQAEFRDGVLRVILPKVKQQRGE